MVVFTAPKNFNGSFFNSKKIKRVPRKFKKKWKHILQGDRYDFLTLHQKLWFIQWQTNPEYNKFLIKYICENEQTKN